MSYYERRVDRINVFNWKVRVLKVNATAKRTADTAPTYLKRYFVSLRPRDKIPHKKRNESMGIYFGHILLLNWLTCLDETKPKNMFAESVKIWVLKQISSITANSDQSFIWCTKKGAD